jgi:hypothetical protein
MNPEVFRRLARRCREMMLLTRTDAARQRLGEIAEELEAYAEAIERRREAADTCEE